MNITRVEYVPVFQESFFFMAWRHIEPEKTTNKLFASISARLTYKLQAIFDVAFPQSENEMVAT